ncbi:MAG: SIMPL domain-containing protein [Candidatus Paceibacterota bacterium]
MEQNIKNGLWVAVAIAILAVGYSAISYSNSYGKSIQPSSFRSFSVTGDGKANAIPDIAEFSFTVITEGGKDISALQTENTNKANKAIEFVKSKGVEEKDIKTQYYNINPRYQTYSCEVSIYTPSDSMSSVRPCPPATIVGYTITQTVDVKIRDFGKIGDIMSGVVSNGANSLGSLSFTIDDPTTVQTEARDEAIAKAKAKAESVAKAGGFKIGRLLNIQEGYRSYPQYEYMSSGNGISAKTLDAAAPSIQPGSQDVSVTVTMQYEIQ